MNELSLFSIEFLLIFAVSLIVYFAIPRKLQWCALLAFSVIFFLLSSARYTIVYLIISTIVTHVSTLAIPRQSDKKQKTKWLVVGILGNIVILALLKYSGFAVSNVNSIARIFKGIPTLIPIPEWAAPIGISYYTLSAIGYAVDCYTGVSNPANNVFKTMLFICYWPIMTSGPILKYKQISEQLFEGGRRFDVNFFCFGIQRMLWGFIKKIVVSARLGIVVDAIYADTQKYSGLYIWVAATFFVLQLYTDFSGCMDIILGASECYGIVLPENFRMPFFSKSIQEFWQRWHITLGEWYRNYILYPIMNTKGMTALEKKLKKKYGRKKGRLITSCMGMLFVWLLFGLWHGGKWKYVAMGLYFWVLIVFENVTQEWFDKLWNKLKVPTDTIGWKMLRCLRVFILVTIGDMFFRVQNVKITLATWKLAIKWNPWIFFDDSFYNLGLSQKSFNMMLVWIGIMFVVSLFKRKGDVRLMIARQPLPIRWSIYLALLFAPLILGVYGPDYDAAAFIYKGF